MKVSVIVANHNRNIDELKMSVLESTYHDIEFIEINKGFERSKQRNMGIQQAKGEIILWLDSDMTISSGLIKECVELIKMGCTAVFVPEIIVGRSLFASIRRFERGFLTGTAVDVPRAILRRVMPLFDESMSGPEDADMGQRIPGIKAVSTNPLYHHDDISLFEYCRKKAYYSKSMKRYAEKWPSDPCLNPVYRSFTVFTENGKWKRLLKHPILTLGIIFLLATRAVIYYTNR